MKLRLLIYVSVALLGRTATAGNDLYVRGERKKPLTKEERTHVERAVVEMNRALRPDAVLHLRYDRGIEGKLLFKGIADGIDLTPAPRLLVALAQLTGLRHRLVDAHVTASDDAGLVKWSPQRDAFVLDASLPAEPDEPPTVMKKLGIRREPEFVYSVSGNPIVVYRQRGHEKPMKVIATHVPNVQGYFYLLSRDGDLVRVAP